MTRAEAEAEIRGCGLQPKLTITRHPKLQYQIVLVGARGEEYTVPAYEDEEDAWLVAVDMAHELS